MKGKIFNTEQVRAIQEGRMTQFMQEVKSRHESGIFQVCRNRDGVITSIYSLDWDERNCERDVVCPFGKVGDVIYVREGWFNDADSEEAPIYVHKGYSPNFPLGGCKWKSPATMPREAARLFLRIENIRVMRVQELSVMEFEKQDRRNAYVHMPSFRPNCLSEEIWNANKYHWIIDFTKTDKP